MTADELASEWSPEALGSIPLYRSLPHEEKYELMRGVAELQLLGDTTTSDFDHLKAFLDASAVSGGDPSAQFLLGALAEQPSRHDSDTFAGTDPASAVLFYEFASRGGSLPATMALGYRYLHGYNVPRSCDAAMQYYRHAADRVIAEEASRGALLPSQMFSLPEPVRLSDNHHRNDRRSHPQRDQEDFSQAEYLRHRALASRKPELMERSASIVLFSDLYCSPSPWKQIDDDMTETCSSRGQEAVAFLEEAAGTGSYSARALLGHVYAFSLGGVEKNVSRAIDLYQEALGMSRDAGTIAAEAANGLGLVYSSGLDGTHTADAKQAMSFFKLAADAGLADGVYNMAVMLSDAYPAHAKDYFVAAAEVGHLNSLYELARLKASEYSGSSRASTTCSEVVSLFKQVAEHSAELTRVLDLALVHFNAGSWDKARLLYGIAAEMGSEVAQSNAAWVTERKWTWSARTFSIEDANEDYLRLVRRAAAQDSPDAFIRLGDWEFARGNHAIALTHYTDADEISHGISGRALHSIGYMHEHGLGGAIQSYERAALYYLFAGDTERVMWFPMAMLRYKLQVQIAAARLQAVSDTILLAVREMWTRSMTSTDSKTQSDGQVEVSSDAWERTSVDAWADNEDTRSQRTQQVKSLDVDATPSSAHLEFVAALQFAGQESQLDVELSMPLLGIEFQDFTVESWVCIDASTDLDAPEGNRKSMVLVDALDNFQVELVPDSRDESAWQVRFRKFSLVRGDRPEMSVVFVGASLQSERWYHLVLTFDARTQTIALFVNGQARGQFSMQPRRFSELSDDLVDVDRSAASRIVSIGSSLSRHVDAANVVGFRGQLARFRVWRERILPGQIPRLNDSTDADATNPSTATAVHEQLAIDLRCHLQQRSTSVDDTITDAQVLNGDRFVPSARGMQLRMIPFPPAVV